MFKVAAAPSQTMFEDAVNVGTEGSIQLTPSNKRKLSIAHSSLFELFEKTLNLRLKVVPVAGIDLSNSLKIFVNNTPSPISLPVVSSRSCLVDTPSAKKAINLTYGAASIEYSTII